MLHGSRYGRRERGKSIQGLTLLRPHPLAQLVGRAHHFLEVLVPLNRAGFSA